MTPRSVSAFSFFLVRQWIHIPASLWRRFGTVLSGRWRDGNGRAASNNSRFGASSKSSQIQQVVKGERANFDNKLKRKTSKSDLHDSEFADICCKALLSMASWSAP